jgi:hypothetical protein
MFRPRRRNQPRKQVARPAADEQPRAAWRKNRRQVIERAGRLQALLRFFPNLWLGQDFRQRVLAGLGCVFSLSLVDQKNRSY